MLCRSLTKSRVRSRRRSGNLRAGSGFSRHHHAGIVVEIVFGLIPNRNMLHRNIKAKHRYSTSMLWNRYMAVPPQIHAANCPCWTAQGNMTTNRSQCSRRHRLLAVHEYGKTRTATTLVVLCCPTFLSDEERKLSVAPIPRLVRLFHHLDVT